MAPVGPCTTTGGLLLLIRAVGNGSGSYADFLDWADTPWVVLLHVVTLAFLVYHSVTWFQLTPKAMVLGRSSTRGASPSDGAR
jgi:fumarate reductase subunit C